MTPLGNKEKDYFTRAFELAYFVHVHKEIAFFVAEDALDGLDSMLGHHEKNRTPADRLRGFLKSGERTRPIRKTIRLNEPQMLQWLVYRQSEAWERLTERGEGFYLPSEEDLIVRYLEYLVFISLRRGSFYVTLAVGALLHQFDRRETRLFYDILTQSDSARLKDTNYIGKQRLEMLDKVSGRFGEMIQTVGRPGDEKQFEALPLTPPVTKLVNETLRRFKPWETTCVIAPGFDVTDIPALYFSETSASDEELIELHRIHTVLDPECLATFADGLGRYVRMLPDGDKDKSCNYDLLDERLRVPQFSNFPGGPSRGDRFQSPRLTQEDYVRLQRTLDARAQRRKVFVPQQLRIYVDDVLSFSLDPNRANRGVWFIPPEAGVVEVRGQDTVGELTLATLLLDEDQIAGGTFADSVVHPGGQKVTISLSPVRDAKGAVIGAQLEVNYQDRRFRGPVSQLMHRGMLLIGARKDDDRGRAGSTPGHVWWARIGIVGLLAVVAALIWWQLRVRSTQPQPILSERTEQAPGEQQIAGQTPIPVASPSPFSRQSPVPREARALVARVSWSADREAAIRALAIEPTRGETRIIDLTQPEVQVLLSVPVYDHQGRSYSKYRISLSSVEARLWQQTLLSPRVSLTGYAHILDLSLFTGQLHGTRPFEVRVEGSIQGTWQPIGKVRFSPRE